MSVATERPEARQPMTRTAQRRLRLAALIGLVALLTMVGFAIVVIVRTDQANQTAPVLKATRDIQAGTRITDDEVGVASIRVDDPVILSTLMSASDRSSLVGQVAVQGVRAGSLIPAGLGASQATANLWEVPLKVAQMPPDLKAGDHVALLVSGTGKLGQPVETVAAQDVPVLAVQQGAVVLWLPASSAAQMELDAAHGDVVVAKMLPGAVQRGLTQAGGS